MVGRAKRQLSCFVITLSWSRALYLEFFFDQTTENFLRGHVRAFQARDQAGSVLALCRFCPIALPVASLSSSSVDKPRSHTTRVYSAGRI